MMVSHLCVFCKIGKDRLNHAINGHANVFMSNNFFASKTMQMLFIVTNKYQQIRLFGETSPFR